MLWIKNPEGLKEAFKESTIRVWERIRDREFIYENENGKKRTIFHDGVNVLVEVTRADPYFAAHWFLILLIVAVVL